MDCVDCLPLLSCKVMLNDSKMGWFTWLPRCLESFLKKLKRERKRVQDTKEGTRCQWGSAPDDVETIQRGLSTSLHVDRHRSRRADACRHVQGALEPLRRLESSKRGALPRQWDGVKQGFIVLVFKFVTTDTSHYAETRAYCHRCSPRQPLPTTGLLA